MSRRGAVRVSLRDKAANLAGGEDFGGSTEPSSRVIDARIIRVGNRSRSTMGGVRPESSIEAGAGGGDLAAEVERLTARLARVKQSAAESDAEWENEFGRMVGQLEIAQEQLTHFANDASDRSSGLLDENRKLKAQLAADQSDMEKLTAEMEMVDRDHGKLQAQAVQLETINLEQAQLIQALQQGSAQGLATQQLSGSEHVAALQDELHQAADALEKVMGEKEDWEIKCKHHELDVNRLEEALEGNQQISMQQTDHISDRKIEQLQLGERTALLKHAISLPS